jgi:hypothetical protein
MNQAGNGDSPIELQVFTQWPGFSGQKVKSLVSYSESKTHRKQFGNDIDDNSEIVKWTKLDLDPKLLNDHLKQVHSATKGLDRIKSLVQSISRNGQEMLDLDIPLHITKNTTEIIEYFFEKALAAWKAHIQARADGLLGVVPIDIVVTHPAVSSYPDVFNAAYLSNATDSRN